MNSSFRTLPIALCLLQALAARAVTFTSDTTIDFTNSTYDNADIVVTNCAVTINGPHSFASVQVLNGGRLTHTASDTGLLVEYFQTNEPLTLVSTNPVALNAANVLTGTVLVTDTSGLIIYTNGTDYLLGSGAPGVTTLQRTDSSTIPDGATVSVTYNASRVLGPSGLNLTIAGDMLIEQGGAIALNGLGYNGGNGPGHGASAGSPPAGGGGGYGGSGGLSSSNGVGGAAYGVLSQPADKGSEGGTGTVGPGGSGGGAVKLTVGRLLRINGSISASGANATNERAGGGSGGGIWLVTQTFAGSGTVSADGGDGEPPQGGGGGGGRIAIFSQTNTFSGALSARGGRGAQNGGAGTVYSHAGPAVGSAIVDNAGRSGATTPLSTTEAFALTVKGGARISISSPQTLGSLLLTSNGSVLMSGSTLTVTGDANIQPGSAITADAAGYAAGAGPGAGRFSSLSGYLRGSGAGYGGAGIGVATDAPGGGCYGSLKQPTDLGSGGGNGTGTYPYNLGGAGGGAVLLNVNGSLTLGGTISANGGAGVGQGSGGGSGGSVWLNVGTLAGAGTLSACGGLGNDVGGAGGGGRIALYYQNSSFTGTMKAWGPGSGANVAGAGTIYTKITGQSVGQLLVDNGGPTAAAGSVFAAPEALALTIQGGATASLLTSQTLGSLLINPNGWLRLSNLTFTISGDANVATGGGIVADGTGPGNGSGTGAGHSFPLTGGATSSYGGGGGYGGYGAFGGTSLGGTTYGSASQAATVGSGGGSAGGTNFGGAGGGMIPLTISGTLTLNGRISADGTTGLGLNSGGGSGGGIALTVGTLSGSGLISANGGPGTGFGGGGGGGRIAVNYTTSYFMGTMRAWGGGGARFGGAGTIYSKASSQSVAQLTMDNGGALGNVTDATSSGTVDLSLTGGAVISNASLSLPVLNNLLIASNSWLVCAYPGVATVTIGGSATIQAGGGIRADGTGPTGGSGTGAGRNYYYNTMYIGSGGAYGGYGAPALGAVGGTAYGSALSGPVAGSGGGNGNTSPTGGSGGGSLTLRVTGILVLDGRLSADGGPALPGSNAGGGSGGSVYITTAALMGAGSISANGGAGDSLGGGGGGGRIFLLPSVNSFVGTVSTYGGNGSARGGAGTIYTSVGQSTGQILADNGGLPGTNTLVQDTGVYDLTIKGTALLSLSSSSVSVRDLYIGTNSWLLFPGYPYVGQATINISGSAVLDAGGGIKADGAGSPAASGSGAGRTYTLGSTNVGSGAGYGGYGGIAGLAGAWGGNAYGLAASGPTAGSGGGTAGSYNYGGAGGGSVTLNVTGSLIVDGKISANGAPAQGGNAGGGSGGGIYISGGTLLGTGTISANGGAALGLGGGGGGGRIMLRPNVNVFSGLVTAYGGDGFSRGGAGSIYTLVSGQTGQMLADNGGLPGTNTLFSDSGSFDLTVKGAAKAYLNSMSVSPRDLYVAANSWLVIPVSPEAVNITGNAVLEAGGGILADGLGYAAGAGPGAGYIIYSSGIHGGGGYGGNGGGAVAEVASGGGTSYGSVQEPIALGSGGAGAGIPPTGGAGGGAVVLRITGTLDLEGRITANGNPGSQNSGGGSGGSVFLIVGTILGSGAISANGGNGIGLGSGGGGGRIALRYGANLFNGTITAYGGTGYVAGGAGTIYTSPIPLGQNHPQVVVDNGGRAGENTDLSSAGSSTDITIKNGGIAWAYPGSSTHNLLVLSNGWVSFHGPGYHPPLNVTGDATIQAGGGLVAEGPAATLGSVPGGGGGSASSASGTAGGGGAHGGSGASSLTGGAGGAAYDSPTAPASTGSSGGNGPDSVQGGYGGGVVAVNVTGTLQLDGRASANGTGGMSPGGGGGSGGTVSLSVGRLAGAGSISANGGNGDGLGGGGGGGRILVRYNSTTFAGSVTAFGGGGAAAGGAGTIYTWPTTQSSGLLLVDNAGQSGTNTPLSYSSVLDLTIQNGAILSLSSAYARWSNLVINASGTLTCSRSQTNLDLTLLGNARIETGGSLSVDGGGFPLGVGPGAGLFANFIGSGAGYGGAGGASSVAPGGGTYGSAQQPVERGSGGGLGWGIPSAGSEGGGALRLFVARALTVNGRISANGNAGLQDDTGGGSGGSIWVEAGSVAGNGAISADGGPGELFEGGGGGGGRIAIYSRTNSFAGQATAAGALGYYWGQDGSVYVSSTFAPPAVVAQTPVGVVSNGVSTVDLFFNTPLNPYSLSSANIVLTTPIGPVSPGASLVGSTHLQLAFPLQTVVGAYTLTVGPNLQDLFGQPMSQVYTGSFTISLPVIQGTVADLGGLPVPGVLIQPTDGFSSAVTDTNGNYVLGVPPGSDVTVIPALDGLVLVPAARVYTNVTASISNQNYLAVSSIVPTVTATSGPSSVSMSWFGIPGVTYQPFSSTNLVDWVPDGQPLVGTNGPAQLIMPTGPDPMKFFRLSAIN